MNPELFNLFGFSIRWYSILILLGVVIGFCLAIKEGNKKGYQKDTIIDLGFWCILLGILGARLYYVAFNFNLYKNNPIEILEIWNGGLAIHGGIIAGIITIIVYCKKNKISVFQTTDIIVPSLILAQAIGRWGNFFNSEAHGPITSLESLERIIIIPKFVIKGMNINGIYYHPTFYYESLWCIFGFILLIITRSLFKSLKIGQLTCIYFIWYGIGRFFIESIRTDSLMIGNIRVAQIVSIIFVVLGVVTFIIFSLKNQKNSQN